MKVNFVDLVSQHASIQAEIQEELDKVMGSASFVLGPSVREFEEAFADYCGAKHCVGVASGADALILALKALGIGPGDEVITVANTFIATTNAIALVGATPVLVDIDPGTYTINVDLIEAAITDKTKCIMPVHLYGQPVDMEPIRALAKKHGLKILEDAAQAHGATYRGQRTGTLGDAAGFSFYPGKNLGAYGEGGAVVTNDDQIAEAVRVYRDVGQSEKYIHPVIGHNSRLHSMQAAVLKVKLKYLDEWNAKRSHFAKRYQELLADTSLVLPKVAPDAESVWHLFVVQHEQRDALMQALKEQDIYCGIHYPRPIHKQAPYAHVRTVPDNAPITSDIADKLLSLPMHPELTEEQVQKVATAIHDFEASQS